MNIGESHSNVKTYSTIRVLILEMKNNDPIYGCVHIGVVFFFGRKELAGCWRVLYCGTSSKKCQHTDYDYLLLYYTIF